MCSFPVANAYLVRVFPAHGTACLCVAYSEGLFYEAALAVMVECDGTGPRTFIPTPTRYYALGVRALATPAYRVYTLSK